MIDSKLVILLPTPEHIAELKEKGVDFEVELTRIVYDNLKLIKADKNPRRLGIEITKAQMDDLQKYGINAAEYCAAEFKKELHSMLTNKRKD